MYGVTTSPEFAGSADHNAFDPTKSLRLQLVLQLGRNIADHFKLWIVNLAAAPEESIGERVNILPLLWCGGQISSAGRSRQDQQCSRNYANSHEFSPLLHLMEV